MTRRRLLVVGWILALLGAAAFARLGAWQAGRGAEKAERIAAVGALLEARRAVPLAAAGDVARASDYDWSAGRGRFDPAHVLLLDNQQRDGRVGVRVYGVFRPETGAPLLVDLGWLPLPGDRRLPAVALPQGAVDVRGLLAPPPAPGIDVGAPLTRRDGAWLMLRVDPAVVGATIGIDAPLAPRVLRLDPALPIGHARDLELFPNSLTPERHRGYAVQWFGLAATAIVIALVLTFRRSRR